VKFIQNGRYKYIPYHKVFERLEELGLCFLSLVFVAMFCPENL
jgi:hypothetical protein